MLEFAKNNMILFAAVFGMVLGVPMAWKRRESIGIKYTWQFLLLCALSWVFGYLGMKLIAVFEEACGLATSDRRNYGFFLIEPFVLMIYANILKLDKSALFDAVAIYSIPTMFFGRVVCMLQGCCGGIRVFESQLKWPTRELELIFFAVLLVVLLQLEKKRQNKGLLYPLFMISYGLFRFATEWLRTGIALMLGMHIAHFWMILLLIIGASILFELKLRAERKAAHENRHRRK